MRGVREVDGAGRKGERGRGEGRERAAGGAASERSRERGSEGGRDERKENERGGVWVGGGVASTGPLETSVREPHKQTAREIVRCEIPKKNVTNAARPESASRNSVEHVPDRAVFVRLSSGISHLTNPQTPCL